MKLPKNIFANFLKILIGNEKNEERTYFILTLLTGVISALVAVSLQKIGYFLTYAFGTNMAFDLKAFLWGAFAILVSGIITTRYYPSTAGSGVPGVRVALAVYHGKISFRATIAKYVATFLSLSAGFSVGREGPTVAVAAGLGSKLGHIFHLSKKRVKGLVAVGAAGGIAAGFHTPIAAVVFTLEEVVGDLNAKVLGNIIIASVVASIVSLFLTGQDASFADAFNYHLNDYIELIFYLAIGIICSFLGPLWVKSSLMLRSFNHRIFKNHKLSIIMMSFLIIALISHIDPRALGSGHETVEHALKSLFLDWKVLISLYLLNFIATTISFTSGVSGGIFMPTLLMGAMIGNLVGSLAGTLYPGVVENTGAYALVGMGANFAAVIRAPFTSILIVFELTRNYSIILPLMIANIVSYALASRFLKGSIYENISEQDGIHLPSKEDNDILEALVIEDAMVTDVISFNSQITVGEAFKNLENTHAYISGFPILQYGLLNGVVARNTIKAEMARGNANRSLDEIAEKKIITVYPDQSLLVAFHKLKKYQVSRLPVVSRINDKKMIGIITAEDIVANFGYHIQQEAVQESTDTTTTNEDLPQNKPKEQT